MSMARAMVKIKYAPVQTHFLTENVLDVIRKFDADGMYSKESKVFEVKGSGIDAAEEVFDLTNNPGRQDERVKVYGCGQSLSSGDIVVVDGEQFVCMSFGWECL